MPDVAKLLLDIDKNQKAVDEIIKQYTCHLTEEEEKTDSSGQVTSRSVKEYDIFYVGDDEIRHLLAKDGKPLEGDEKKKAVSYTHLDVYKRQIVAVRTVFHP